MYSISNMNEDCVNEIMKYLPNLKCIRKQKDFVFSGVIEPKLEENTTKELHILCKKHKLIRGKQNVNETIGFRRKKYKKLLINYHYKNQKLKEEDLNKFHKLSAGISVGCYYNYKLYFGVVKEVIYNKKVLINGLNYNNLPFDFWDRSLDEKDKHRRVNEIIYDEDNEKLEKNIYTYEIRFLIKDLL